MHALKSSCIEVKLAVTSPISPALFISSGCHSTVGVYRGLRSYMAFLHTTKPVNGHGKSLQREEKGCRVLRFVLIAFLTEISFRSGRQKVCSHVMSKRFEDHHLVQAACSSLEDVGATRTREARSPAGVLARDLEKHGRIAPGPRTPRLPGSCCMYAFSNTLPTTHAHTRAHRCTHTCIKYVCMDMGSCAHTW